MFILLIAFMAALLVGIPMTNLARRMGVRLGIVDQPDNYRKVHKKPIPLCGGYAIFATVVSVVLTLMFSSESEVQFLWERSYELIILLCGATIMLAVGAVDDILDLRPKYKLLFQLIAASACYFGGFKIAIVSIPFGQSIDVGVFSYFITVFWFLGCINAINLLDGLDGLAGGVGLFVILTLLFNAIIRGDVFGILICATIAGAILAFLFFNFNPASIFLGDAGSMLIGFLVAALSLKVSNKAETTFALLIPFIAIGLPVFDTIAAILRRWGRRVPISSADRKHVHHVLLAMGFSTRKVVLILYGVCIVLGGISLLLTMGRDNIAVGFLFILLIMTVVGAKMHGVINFSQLGNRINEDRCEKKRSGRAATEVEKAITQFSKASRITELWDFAKPALEALELDHAFLELERGGVTRKMVWRSKDYDHHHNQANKKVVDEWSLFLKLYEEEVVFGKIEIWKISEEMPIRDICYQINKLRSGLSYHLNRIDLKRTQRLTDEMLRDLDLGETCSNLSSSPSVLPKLSTTFRS